LAVLYPGEAITDVGSVMNGHNFVGCLGQTGLGLFLSSSKFFVFFFFLLHHCEVAHKNNYLTYELSSRSFKNFQVDLLFSMI
jgi:hypothetical protein